MRIALPRFGENVAPCFEYSSTMAIFTVEEGKVVAQVDFPLESKVPYDRVRLMRLEQVEVVICGGVQESFEDILQTNGIEVISWVSGKVEDLIRAYLAGTLVAGKARTITPDMIGGTDADNRRHA